MKKFSLALAVIALLFASVFSASAQQQADWIELMNAPNPNLFEVQKAFEEAYPDGDYPRGSGWKKFERWKTYYLDRVDTDGNIRPAEEVVNEVRRYFNAIGGRTYLPGTGNWQEVGPIQKPANGTGQPNGNGRINCVAFHPTDANTIYAGSPSGGFWESNNDGLSWTKRVDGLVRLGVSSIVVHPANPDIIYIGTGDRDAGDAPGYGVYRSLDGGNTWNPHNNGMGNVTVNEIIMDPTDSDIMIASTVNRVYRTTDGGNNWTPTLLTHDCEDIAMHPGDHNILYAAGSNAYRSIDNGATWVQITAATGFNPNGHNRIALAVSAAAPNTAYALASGGNGLVGMYRSTDSGLTWTLQSNSPNVSGYDASGNDSASQSFYDHVMVADPTDADVVYFGGVNIWKTADGGATWQLAAHWVGSGGAAAVHADHHALEFNPLNNRLYSGNDGGVYKTDNGTSWTEISNGLAIAQVYKLGVSQTEQDLVINGYQDNGTSVYAEDTGWRTEIGGDGFECAIDPTDENYIYGSLYYGQVLRSTNKGFNFSTIAEDGTGGITESGAFSAPFVLDPNDETRLYVGMKNVWRTTDVKAGTPSFTQISAIGNTNLRDMAISPASSDRMLTSNNDGFFFRTTNLSTTSPTWDNITGNLLSGSIVKDIAYHPTNPDIVFITQGNNIYRSLDNGASWADFSGTLPNISANAIVFDKDSPNEAMYLGMDVGVYYRDNTLADWQLFMTGLPNVEITDLEIHADADECRSLLYASTYGAGMWKTELKDPGGLAPVACFELANAVACGTSSISLSDKSDFSPTSWTWNITPATFSFTNGTNAGSQNPVINVTASGNYTIELTATNGLGSDTRTKTETVTIEAAGNLPYSTDFEAATNNFTIENPDNNTTWATTSTVSAYGTGGSALFINNFSYDAAGQQDYYVSDLGDLNGVNDAVLNFDVAYAPYSASFSDGLRVQVSTNCGNSWQTVYDKSGLDLSTNGGNYVTSQFVPTDTEWRSESISLAAFANQYVKVRFVGLNGYGNNLYLDNIDFTSSAILPIILRDFTGRNVPETGNELYWTMEDEEEGTSFDVQRFHRRSGEWRTLGTVAADGSLSYTLTDVYPEYGSNLYRLAINQYGALQEYSPVIELKVAQALRSVSLYPNPAESILHIDTQSEKAGLQPLLISDVTGKILLFATLDVPAGSGTQSVDISGLASGVYFVKIGEEVQRVVKK